MAIEEIKIQSLVFPIEDKHRQSEKLFYRGEGGIVDYEKNEFRIGYSQKIDFSTYINACSYRKWKKFTNCGRLIIRMEITGNARISFVGYNKDLFTVTKTVFDEKDYKESGKYIIEYKFPENNEQIIGIEVTALQDCVIHNGGYYLEIDKKEIRHVNLSLVTTTYKKEDFIKKNVGLIKKNIIKSGEDISGNFTLHVVDNGRTLSKDDINGENVFLHSNINAGGSGGFARGMYESIHQKKEVTHVLLMDDDVIVLPESIKRTYNLLKILKDEYRGHFINGAMLYYEDPARQHEDIGTVVGDNNKCSFMPLKRVFNHEIVEDNILNEKIEGGRKNSYSAWWYCCIPMETIKRNGLPLPLFIRGDDCEYSLRCGANIITMNGICIWHMGFSAKYNATFDLYQKYRNWLIMQSASNVIQEANLMNCIKNAFKVEILRFNYNAAELIIRALEDYLKGPTFIKSVDGEKNNNANFELNDKLVPLNELGFDGPIDIEKIFEYTPPTLKERIIAKITWNGQRLYPDFLDNSDIGVISFNEFFRLHGIVRKNKLLAVNPYTMSGIYRIKDKKRFRELMKRFKKAEREYYSKKDIISKEYNSARKELTSERFWKKYLGI